ncbi:GntR family transcriptional regulator [Bacillus sp. AM 13(2015)]|uniref:GntR family transcriptional regulator n=1 Tax=Bacillus sp. AM 13(2015) TaxID=1739115 RepID=UPI000750F8E4|nr:winged helix-turn-helix domain-containing protein [Bacillus sp. AM 13(2015)]KUR61303.1 hypothetical protein AOQ70_00005 [Bacillus sp. AM 13(2015)]
MQSGRNETKTRQVYSWIRDRIMQGSYRAGTSLPSTRELAKELGVSRALIVEVYEQLTAEGFLEGKQGSGTFVRDPALGRSSLGCSNRLKLMAVYDEAAVLS